METAEGTQNIDTVQTRKDIGFSDAKEDWNKADAVYDEHTLRIAGHPVMEDWERGYMASLAEIASSRGGVVLEVGYGMGLSAAEIQKHPIDKHFIIECHPDVIKHGIDANRDAVANSRMHFLTGFWEDVTPLIGDNTLDGILFDTYPLTEEEIHSNHFWFFEEARRILKPGGVLTYYSDEAEDFSPAHLARLKEAGFSEEDITFKICDVQPPADCEYWQKNTILAPIVTKSKA